MWRTAETPRLRPSGGVRAVILALETSCDDTCAAVLTAGRRDPLERDLLAGRPRPLRRRRARDRLASPPRADRRRRRRRARSRGRRRSARSTWSPSPAGRAWSAALLVGVGHRQGARRLPRAAARRGRPSPRARGGELPGARSVRAAVPQPDRQRRPHAARARQRSRSRLRGARPDARRRRRRGVRQGRAAARARLSRAARRSSGWLATAIRRRSSSRPRRGCSGLDFSFAGLKTALLYRVRELGRAEAERRRADLAASYQHAIVESLAMRVERALAATGLERLAVGGGVAANGPLRERLAGLGVELDVPPRELCTDNAAMIASAARYVAPLPYPDYLEPRRVRHRRAGAGGLMTHRGAVRPRGLLPVRRRARGAAAGPRRHPFELEERDIDARRRAAAGATSSGSRW